MTAVSLLRALLVCAALLGCDDGPAGAADATRVRVRNASAVELQNLLLLFPGEERLTAGALAPGGVTGYVPVRTAYRYAYLEATVAGRRTVLQPIDYVGERPLGPGCFTYDLTVDAQERHVGIAARAEPGC
jgi:hypothetical protein